MDESHIKRVDFEILADCDCRLIVVVVSELNCLGRRNNCWIFFQIKIDPKLGLHGEVWRPREDPRPLED